MKVCDCSNIEDCDINHDMTSKAATMRDVARLAGVSVMTVSRVVNGEMNVRAKTRQVVEVAINTLSYTPNPLARALSGREPVRVALLHRFPNSGPLGELIVQLLDSTADAHASLTVRKIRSAAEDKSIVRELISHGVRAAILTPPLADDEILVELLRSEGMALVATGATRLHDRLPSVGIDDHGAARAMTEHLLTLGHRRIAFIKGHPHHASTHLRLQGYCEALARAGLSIEEELIDEGLYTYQSGLDAAERLLDLSAPPSAIFASNDDMAAATVATAHRRGIDVPADLSVCGFDDTTLATTIWPALTTIRQPIAEVTRAAIALLLDQLSTKVQGGQAKQRVLFDFHLVRRQSEAPPRRRPAASA